MKTYALSTGRLSLAREILAVLKGGRLSADKLTNHLSMRSEIFTQNLIDEVISLLIQLGLITGMKGEYELTERGAGVTDDTESSFSESRRILRIVLTHIRKDLLWVAAVPNTELKHLKKGEYQCFKDLGLIGAELTESAQEWWESLKSAGKVDFDQESKKAAGDLAENLSLAFERNYLASGGREDLQDLVRWVSRDSDLLGYDILSFSLDELGAESRKQIEVKKLSVDSRGLDYFFLSANEFEIARKFVKTYVFHLWRLDDSKEILFELSAKEVLGLIPPPKLERFIWHSAKIFPELSKASVTRFENGDK